jgi:hypothetical protein
MQKDLVRFFHQRVVLSTHASSTGQAGGLRLSTNITDRLLIARLELDPQSMS